MRPVILHQLLAAATLTLAGCASNTPNLDAHFGQAVLAARAQQTINPQASLSATPTYGVDGRAAREATLRYYDSFKTPPPTFPVINIGNSMTSNSGNK